MFIKIFILKKVKLFHETKDIKNDAVNRNYYMMMDCTLKWMLLKTSLKISLFF